MIDIKIGEEQKTPINNSPQENYSEENILIQIRHFRDKLSEYEEEKHKQRKYTNVILTLIFIVLFIIALPTIFTITTMIYNASF